MEETVDSFNVSVLTKSNKKIEINGNFNLIVADLQNPTQLCNELKNKEFCYVIHASMNDITKFFIFKLITELSGVL